ncbi:hypothetical protein [Lyngbya sp. CCY1209]|uniref:hypothetical protein n=1 Tax=Lyngbya sp. CCY1209 TaxID=2886103 RepID=UPI002D1FC41F|nr:hypothetical protein [Lyngbya sp. CCY1209]MEB3886233.1 hypothetical protein [Lyngbya sp. CCY1209]
MTERSQRPETINSSDYRLRTPEDYLQGMDAEILHSFDARQRQAIERLLRDAIPKPSPKVVDLRFTVDLILGRFYVVLFVGKERRRGVRSYLPARATQVGNAIAAIVLLVGLNLLITSVLFLLLYLLKSALGIDLFSGEHLIDKLNKF